MKEKRQAAAAEASIKWNRMWWSRITVCSRRQQTLLGPAASPPSPGQLEAPTRRHAATADDAHKTSIYRMWRWVESKTRNTGRGEQDCLPAGSATHIHKDKHTRWHLHLCGETHWHVAVQNLSPQRSQLNAQPGNRVLTLKKHVLSTHVHRNKISFRGETFRIRADINTKRLMTVDIVSCWKHLDEMCRPEFCSGVFGFQRVPRVTRCTPNTHTHTAMCVQEIRGDSPPLPVCQWSVDAYHV